MAEFLSPLWEFLFDKFGVFGMVIAASSPIIFLVLIVFVILAIVGFCKAMANRHLESFMKKARAYQEKGDFDNAWQCRMTYLSKKKSATAEDWYEMGVFCADLDDEGGTDPKKEPTYWMKKAAAAGHKDAKFLLASFHHLECIENGEILQAAQAINEIRRLADSHCRMAEDYVKQNDKKVASLLEKDSEYLFAAAYGHAASQAAIGFAYLEEDVSSALSWLLVAAESGEKNAQASCGAIYHDGYNGVEQDKKKALYWYEKAADQGDTDAAFSAGVMRAEGEGCAKNLEAALSRFKQAAADNDPNAEYNVAALYFQLADQYGRSYGARTFRDMNRIPRCRELLEEHEKWLKRAYEHGYEDSTAEKED